MQAVYFDETNTETLCLHKLNAARDRLARYRRGWHLMYIGWIVVILLWMATTLVAVAGGMFGFGIANIILPLVIGSLPAGAGMTVMSLVWFYSFGGKEGPHQAVEGAEFQYAARQEFDLREAEREAKEAEEREQRKNSRTANGPFDSEFPGRLKFDKNYPPSRSRSQY